MSTTLLSGGQPPSSYQVIPPYWVPMSPHRDTQGPKTEDKGRFREDEITQGNPEGNPCGVTCDVDEAAHAGFALLKGGGTAAFHDQAHHQMNAALGHHLTAGSLAFDPAARSMHGLIGLTAGSAVVAPLGVYAMKAGIEEWNGSREMHEKLAKRDEFLAGELAFMQALSKQNHGQLAHNMEKATHTATFRKSENKSFMYANKYNGLIGAFSFLSGLAIVSRIAVELARNLGGAVAADDTDVHGAMEKKALPVGFSATTGLVSNAFAILASGFALALGVAFVKKTQGASKAWTEDLPRMQHHRVTYITDTNYGKFIEKKSAHRAEFAKGFHMKNRFFMAGAGLYAAGTILPVCVKLLAAAGILNSKNVGANIILALFATGIAGALMMGVFSHQFFYGHPAMGRHDQHRYKNMPDLNRDFLTQIDSFAFPEDKGDKEAAIKRGVAMRTAAYTAMHENERSRADFVRQIAARTGRKYVHLAHVGDDDYAQHRPLATQIKARINGGALREKDVTVWASESKHQPELQNFFKSVIDRRAGYLAQSETLKKKMYDEIVKDGDIDEARVKLIDQTLGDLESTHKRLETYKNLAEELGKPGLSRTEFAEHTAKFIDMSINVEEGEETDGSPEEIGKHISKYLMTQMPAMYNHERGCLLEIENHAEKIRTGEVSEHAPHFKPLVPVR